MKKLEKLRTMKKLTKVAIVLSIFLISTIATATLFLYFGEIETEVNIKQCVTIDNVSFDKSIKHKIDLYQCDSVTHVFFSRAKTNLMINQVTTGLIDGLTLDFYYANGSLITFPFILKPNLSLKITMTYRADINLEPQKVKIITRFSVSEI